MHEVVHVHLGMAVSKCAAPPLCALLQRLSPTIEPCATACLSANACAVTRQQACVAPRRGRRKLRACPLRAARQIMME
eukprot:6177417-Pleurochrysis_carterae.AAC.5